MEIIIFILAFLVILLIVITLVGHAIWLLAAAIIKGLRGESEASRYQTPDLFPCANCHGAIASEATVCTICGVAKRSATIVELLKDLAAASRQLERFHRSGEIDNPIYETLKEKLETERLKLLSTQGPAWAVTPPSAGVPPSFQESPSVIQPDTTSYGEPPTMVHSAVFTSIESVSLSSGPASPVFLAEVLPFSDNEEATTFLPKRSVPLPQRKPITEVIAAFMEESNIRWGEIIGGLLIIGCSTALVISLWAEISQIPVLQFLIFTTVTTALFGVGLYTEHRWKLPTTSRGILTIATLLVSLNFLAIAAVSGGNMSPDMLVIVSELVAPAVFLCLVYFAGRVLTPLWPHLLTAGVLGSSIGQLLVRHFAAPEISPVMLVGLGAFPIACYVGGALWMLHKLATQRELLEEESTAIFITLGALTFANGARYIIVIPIGPLLYKSWVPSGSAPAGNWLLQAGLPCACLPRFLSCNRRRGFVAEPSS
jgi:hypothetical protein